MSRSDPDLTVQADGVQDRVRSLWVPLREMNLLLPNMVVAEISSYRTPREVPGMPEWLLGMVKWHEREIAVVSLESLCGLTVPSNPVFSRLMIVNSVLADSRVEYYGIVTAGLPGLIQFGNDSVDRVDVYDMTGVHCVVQVGNERAVIPDLVYLQGLLEQCLVQAA
jgi:chemosensory pili system protein ChpC